jgi:hypothetical protein
MRSVLRRYFLGAVALALILLAGELLARYGLGLGSPPLVIAHPSIEYLSLPSQDVRRFGNRYLTNRYGMRSEDFSADKAVGGYRLMIFGDSVINGGALTDQDQLATTRIARQLRIDRPGPVVVGNVSAGSWGPGNWLAYAREFGFFQADAVILVISAHDYEDVPTFGPLDPTTHPTQAPVSALVEGIERYLPRYLPKFMARKLTADSAPPLPPRDREEDIRRSLADLHDFLVLAQSQSSQVLVFQHWEQKELARGIESIGNRKIREVCAALRVPTFSLAEPFRSAQQRGEQPYRDNIHPNALGQALIADAILGQLSPNRLL